MISTMRNQKKITAFVLWFIIAAFVGTIFFVWGIGDKVSKQNFAVKINDVTISDQDFQQRLDAARENFRRLFGNNSDALLKDNVLEKTVLDQAITETLLSQEAERLNIPVSDSEVAASVQSIEAFQDNGVFNMQRYTDLLARNRLTPQMFEANVRNDLTVQKITDLIKKSVYVTDQEIKNEFLYRNTSAVVSYVELNADDFNSSIKYTQEDLQKYYDANKKDYRVPEKADFKVLVFNPQQYTPNVAVSDKEIENYYINNKATLAQPEKVRASHILVKVADWNNKSAVDAAQQKIDGILSEVKGGADFAEEAKKYSDDPSGKSGGDLGYFTKGQMVPQFEAVAFRLKPGDVSDVVKTQFGFHIIKVTDKQGSSEQPTLEMVKPKIIEEIKKAKTDASFRAAVYDKYRQIVDASNLSAYNLKHNNELPLAVLKGVTASGAGTPFAKMPDITKNIMKLNKSEISELMDAGTSKLVFEMTNKYPAYIPKLKDIQATVIKDYVSHKSIEAAAAKAEEYAKLGNIQAVGSASGKTPVTPVAFIRTEPISGLGMNNGLMDMIFKTKPGTFISKPYTIGKKVFLVEVVSLTKPDMKNLATQKDGIVSALVGTKSDAAFKDYVASLKKKAKIEVNDRYKAYVK